MAENNSVVMIKIRKSKIKEDSLKLAEHLKSKHNIDPYSLEELANIITAGLRTGEIEFNDGNAVKNVEEWFVKRLMPNTIILSDEDYERALYRAFRLLVLADIAKTDFGSSRQRDFGQRWTDFTRGFLGEIGIEKFFREKLSLTVDLEEKEVGDVKKFLPTDITKVKDGAKWREVKTLISIKTSKLLSMWLDIGSQIGHSNAFIFIKIGLTVDHLVSFMKDNGFLEEIVKIGKKLNEVEDYEKELVALSKRIPDVKPFPTYIAGFVWKEDLEKGSLEIYESKKGNKKIIGGRGKFEVGMASAVEGLGDITPPKHLASLGALRWSNEDWQDLKKKI